MLRLILGGVTLAAAGYGLKKYLEDEENADKVQDKLIKGYEWIDRAEQRSDEFFDGLIEKLDLDEDNNQTEESKHETDKIFHEFWDLKKTLYLTIFKEADLALKEIHNLPEEKKSVFARSYDGRTSFVEPTEENSGKIKEFIEIFRKTEKVVEKELDEVEPVLLRSNDYRSYNEEEKEKVDKLIALIENVNGVMKLPLSFDKRNINRAVKRGFERLEKIL